MNFGGSCCQDCRGSRDASVLTGARAAALARSGSGRRVRRRPSPGALRVVDSDLSEHERRCLGVPSDRGPHRCDQLRRRKRLGAVSRPRPPRERLRDGFVAAVGRDEGDRQVRRLRDSRCRCRRGGAPDYVSRSRVAPVVCSRVASFGTAMPLLKNITSRPRVRRRALYPIVYSSRRADSYRPRIAPTSS